MPLAQLTPEQLRAFEPRRKVRKLELYEVETKCPSCGRYDCDGAKVVVTVARSKTRAVEKVALTHEKPAAPGLRWVGDFR